MADTGGQVFGYFRERGLSPAQAAGLVGNFQQESSLNPNAPGGGLDQGQGPRYHGGSLRQQLDAIWGELQGPERNTLGALRGAHDPQSAARIFSQMFERPGIPMLGNRERYASEALKRYAGLSGGGPAPQGGGAPARQAAAPQAAATRSPAQIEDLMALVDALKPSGPSRSVEGLAVPKPTEGGAVRVPTEVPQEAPVSPSSLLSLIDKIGADAAPPPQTGGAASTALPPWHAAPEGAQLGKGGLVNPLPGFHLSRTDMGVDASAAPGTPIKAMGDAKILGIQPNWYAGQPYVYYELLNERGEGKPTSARPHAGEVIYVAEQITPHVHPGQKVRGGDPIGVFAPSGTGIETGLGTHGWQTLAQSEGRTGDSTHGNAPAGIRYRKILEALGAH